jgi:hypothetical protein
VAKQKHVDYLLRVSLAAVGHGALGDGGVRGAARGGGLARYEYECQRLAANRQPPALRAGESSTLFDSVGSSARDATASTSSSTARSGSTCAWITSS